MSIFILLGCAGLAAACVVALHFSVLSHGIDLADEGYLWHGSEQVLEGKVPIRDFRAYDPGRYYWCALWMRLLGRSNRAVRIAMMVAQAAGLWLAAILTYAATSDWWATAVWCVAIGAWLRPWRKSLECTSAIVGVGLAATLVDTPVAACSYGAGVLVALTLLVGLNLALYNGGGALLAILLGFRFAPAAATTTLALYLAGVVTGLAVLMLVFALIPGFLPAYRREKLVRVVKRGTTNLPVKTPWLWRQHPWYQGSEGTFIRSCFTALPFFYVAGLAWLFVRTPDPALSAADAVFTGGVCVGVFYMHHALSRADPGHLSPAMLPLFLALAPLLFRSSIGWLIALAIAGAVLRWLHAANDLFLRRRRNPAAQASYRIDRHSLWLPKTLAADLDTLRDVVSAHTRAGEAVLFLPMLITLYPLFNRRAAVYDTFCVYPASEAAQEEMVASITQQSVRFALIWNVPLDGEEDRRFSKTHPIVWEHLRSRFQPVPLTLASLEDFTCHVSAENG